MKRLAGDLPADAAAVAVPDGLAELVIQWQRRHGRHGLPWQESADPYRVWLSEVMLQQTQVAAVIPYYLRFLERFPDVVSLADADVSEVMSLWSGLGYYSRARNLHRCARMIRDQHAGRFPASAQALAELPGIGRSTAAAIAAFAFGERAAILDGNVKRVFCRLFGIDAYPGEKAVENRLWQLADALLPQEGMQSYTQGLMDLGATLCTRSRPQCDACPLAHHCIAKRDSLTAALPVRKLRKPVPQRKTGMLVAMHGAEVLLELRGPTGIWGGLLSLPELDASDALDQRPVLQAAQAFGKPSTLSALPAFTHGFTHFSLEVQPWLVQLASREPSLRENDRLRWTPLAALPGAPLPAPVRKLLAQLFPQDLLAD